MDSPCAEIKTSKIEKEKKPPTTELVSIVGDEILAELIHDPSRTPPLCYAVYRNGAATVETSLTIAGEQIVPPRAAKNAIQTKLVTLASGVGDYGSQDLLLGDLKIFIHRYADIPEFWEDLIAHYILMTWVYDRFAAVPYLRFLGEYGTGKSRLLTICSRLSYKGISAGGSTTSSPIFRLMEIYHGTFVMDEADYQYSDMWSDLTKVLNQGYMRDFPVVRTEKIGDRHEPVGYDVFGPKIIANRCRFKDRALEQRCLTLETHERATLRNDMPRQLPSRFYDEALGLRNKLLMWRFQRLDSIHVDESPLLDLEPRLAQIGTPIYTVSSDRNFREQFLEYLRAYGSDQKSSKPQAVVIEALMRLKGVSRISVKEIATKCNSILMENDAGEVWQPKTVGGLLRSLGFESKRQKNGHVVHVNPKKLEQLGQHYGPVIVPELQPRGEGKRTVHPEAILAPAAREGGQAIEI